MAASTFPMLPSLSIYDGIQKSSGKRSCARLARKVFEIFAPPIEETMSLPVTTALLNRKIAIMGVCQESLSWNFK